MIKIIPLSLRMSSTYLLENQNGLYLVDAGSPGNERQIMQAIQQRGKPGNRDLFARQIVESMHRWR